MARLWKMVLGTFGDSTGDVVTYEVGVPDNLMGFDLGTMGTTGVGLGPIISMRTCLGVSASSLRGSAVG